MTASNLLVSRSVLPSLSPFVIAAASLPPPPTLSGSFPERGGRAGAGGSRCKKPAQSEISTRSLALPPPSTCSNPSSTAVRVRRPSFHPT